MAPVFNSKSFIYAGGSVMLTPAEANVASVSRLSVSEATMSSLKGENIGFPGELEVMTGHTAKSAIATALTTLDDKLFQYIVSPP